MASTPKKKGGRRRERKSIPVAKVHIHSMFNNTIISVTDLEGGTFAWSSSGARGFRGAKKGTAYAAQIATETVIRKAMDAGLREVYIFPKGPGSGKEAAIRTINNLGIKIKQIKDVTPVAHNGCRPRGRRRV
ncbi:30S ribosomal protein S11 [bacterium]|nr:30S ribosomal protein S11 [bacterium]